MKFNPTMRLPFFGLLTALLFVVGSSFSAQAQRIAIVDVNLVLESMDEYQNAQKEIDKVAAEWRQDIAKEYDNIKSMYNRYQAEQVLLSDEARQKREDEIMEAEKRVRELQRDKFGPEGELFERRRDLVQPIQDKVFEAIEAYADERGYDFIFDKGGSAGLLFAKEDYDKTQEVLRRLN